jgi:hypothetical protein
VGEPGRRRGGRGAMETPAHTGAAHGVRGEAHTGREADVEMSHRGVLSSRLDAQGLSRNRCLEIVPKWAAQTAPKKAARRPGIPIGACGGRAGIEAARENGSPPPPLSWQLPAQVCHFSGCATFPPRPGRRATGSLYDTLCASTGRACVTSHRKRHEPTRRRGEGRSRRIFHLSRVLLLVPDHLSPYGRERMVGDERWRGP